MTSLCWLIEVIEVREYKEPTVGINANWIPFC